MVALLARALVGLVQLLPVIERGLHEINDLWEKAREERAKAQAEAQRQADLKAIEDEKNKP